MTHEDCGDRNCACARRRDMDHGRALIAMGQGLVKRASGAKPTPKPEKKERPATGVGAMDELDALGIPRDAVESVEPLDGQGSL